MTKCIYIKRAIYLGNFIIMFETIEGETRTIDFKPLLSDYMGDFSSLKKEENFKNFFISDVGILTWSVDLPKKNDKQINEFDIAPEYIAEHSFPLIQHKGEFYRKDKGDYFVKVAQQS